MAKNKIQITTDSTCDLNEGLLARYGIKTVSLSVILGEKQYLDVTEISTDEIFDYVDKTGVLPKTSACTTQQYLDFFGALVNDGYEVIHFSLSSGLSGSNGFANSAKEQFGDKVKVIDTLALSSGQGLLPIKAAEMVDEGLSANEIYEKCLTLVPKIQTSFVVDTLDYLYKGGRCNGVAFISAKLLKIHPYIDMQDGNLVVKKKYMGGLSRCLSAYLADLKEFYPDRDNSRCFITHTPCSRELVDMAIEKVKEIFDFKEVFETNAGSVIAAHCGRGTLGLLFIKG